MGWRKNIATAIDLSCILTLSYGLVATIWPNMKIAYVYEASWTWGLITGIYVLLSELSDGAYGSYYDHDIGGYRSFEH